MFSGSSVRKYKVVMYEWNLYTLSFVFLQVYFHTMIVAMFKDVLALLCVISSICWPLTPCYGCEISTTGGCSVVELAGFDETSVVEERINGNKAVMSKWPNCMVTVWKTHLADAAVRLHDTHPKSLEIHQAPLMLTQFVWQWLSEDTGLSDVICQQYTI